jgi:hypothetical protein
VSEICISAQGCMVGFIDIFLKCMVKRTQQPPSLYVGAILQQTDLVHIDTLSHVPRQPTAREAPNIQPPRNLAVWLILILSRVFQVIHRNLNSSTRHLQMSESTISVLLCTGRSAASDSLCKGLRVLQLAGLAQGRCMVCKPNCGPSSLSPTADPLTLPALFCGILPSYGASVLRIDCPS